MKKNCTFCGTEIEAYGRQLYCADCAPKRKYGLFPERIEKRAAYVKEYTQKKRKEVLLHYSNGNPKCECCGETASEFLCIDHINGGGHKHRQKVGCGAGFYLWIIRNDFPEGFRVLCHNCNLSYGFYGYCPHNTE
jgi:hypothetical protein